MSTPSLLMRWHLRGNRRGPMSGPVRTLLIAVLGGIVAGCSSPAAVPDGAAGPDAAPPSAADAMVVDAAPTRLSPVAFTDTYEGHSVLLNRCDHLMNIQGSEPAEPGTYPVALFLVGTNAHYDAPGVVDHVLPLLASHGFVAASIQYENSTLFGAAQNCGLYADNAACMIHNDNDYVNGKRVSALARLCSRPDADCSKGVVLLGHSQGAGTAIQAFRATPVAPPAGTPMPRLVAVAPMGIGPEGYALGIKVFSLESCMTADTIAVSPHDVLVVNGEHDAHFNGPNSDQAGGQLSLETVTGRTCAAGSYDCRGPDGDGWVLVKDSQVSTGSATHGYMDSPDGAFEEPNWSSPDNMESWGLEHAATWLKAQTAP